MSKRPDDLPPIEVAALEILEANINGQPLDASTSTAKRCKSISVQTERMSIDEPDENLAQSCRSVGVSTEFRIGSTSTLSSSWSRTNSNQSTSTQQTSTSTIEPLILPIGNFPPPPNYPPRFRYYAAKTYSPYNNNAKNRIANFANSFDYGQLDYKCVT